MESIGLFYLTLYHFDSLLYSKLKRQSSFLFFIAFFSLKWFDFIERKQKKTCAIAKNTDEKSTIFHALDDAFPMKINSILKEHQSLKPIYHRFTILSISLLHLISTSINISFGKSTSPNWIAIDLVFLVKHVFFFD